MSEVKYTKGEHDEIVKRFNQVYIITIKMPLLDEGVQCLYGYFLKFIDKKKSKDIFYENIPIIDVFNIYMGCLSFCNENSFDTKCLSLIMGILKSFDCLKYVNIKFDDSQDIKKIYDNLLYNEKKIESFKQVYSIDMIEMNLSNMFEQNIIDLFNKCLMHNGLMNNSYLKREFYIDFEYDGYVSFMEMFLGNNGLIFEQMDSNIIDYFRMFPVFIVENKPMIRIITNYSDI